DYHLCSHLLDRPDCGSDKRLRADVVAENECDPLVMLEEDRDADHGIRVILVGRHQPVEVLEATLVEFGLAGLAKRGHMALLQSRHDATGLVRRAADAPEKRRRAG